MSNVLWYICTARKLLPFWSWAEQVNFVDKLIVKNYMKHDADAIAVRYFFKHKYEHLIISTDDILGTPDHVRLLLQDEEEHGFPVIGGWNNFSKGYASLSVGQADSEALRTKVFHAKSYNFVTMKDVVTGKHGYPFIKVWFTGLPLTLIRREVLLKAPFKPFRWKRDRYCVTARAKSAGRGVMQDVQFAVDCARANIPIMVDARIFLLHFPGTWRYLQVGVGKPVIALMRAGARKQRILKVGSPKYLVSATVKAPIQRRSPPSKYPSRQELKKPRKLVKLQKR